MTPLTALYPMLVPRHGTMAHSTHGAAFGQAIANGDSVVWSPCSTVRRGLVSLGGPWACCRLSSCKQNQLITARNLSSCNADHQHGSCVAQARARLRTGAEQEGHPRARAPRGTVSSSVGRCPSSLPEVMC